MMQKTLTPALIEKLNKTCEAFKADNWHPDHIGCNECEDIGWCEDVWRAVCPRDERVKLNGRAEDS